jgi:hypothetical protein
MVSEFEEYEEIFAVSEETCELDLVLRQSLELDFLLEEDRG